MLPWSLLYDLSSKDRQVTWLEPFADQQAISSMNVTITVVSTVPAGRALVLHHAFLRGTPPAPTTSTLLQLSAFSSPGNRITRLKFEGTAGAAGIIRTIDWQGFLLLPPGSTITGVADFSSAATLNAAELCVAGVLIPVGNIQR